MNVAVATIFCLFNPQLVSSSCISETVWHWYKSCFGSCMWSVERHHFNDLRWPKLPKLLPVFTSGSKIIIWKSTTPIFAKFLELVCVWVLMIAVKLVCDRLRDVVTEINLLFNWHIFFEPINWQINNNYQAAREIAGWATVRLCLTSSYILIN